MNHLETSLEVALETDLVLSQNQVRRHHGLTLEACREVGLSVQEVIVTPTAKSRVARAVTFVSLEPLEIPAWELRHLVGIAEVRRVLTAKLEDWQLIHHAAQTSPDAIWSRGLEMWAVEYDAGAYSPATVREKAQAFRAGFDGQVWAVATQARAERLNMLLEREPLVVRAY
jgi:Replication-relaxation